MHAKCQPEIHVKFEYYIYLLLSNFETEIIILPQANEAEIKNGGAYKKKRVALYEMLSKPNFSVFRL